jgi:hypothetical protein
VCVSGCVGAVVAGAMDDKRRPIGVMHDGLATALAVKPGQADELREHGADVVVADLAELLDAT